jgi:ssDNA-binding Zn-finger/Zn-ribbon topoisomerase 1
MSMDTIIRQQVLVAVTCPQCGCLFAFPEHMQEELRKTHADFYCPSGHKQGWYGPNAIERERDKAQKEAERLRRWLADEEQRLASERKAHSATKGKLTKTRKRIAGGVCPCCHRSFTNLGRHMTSKHPDYAEQT